MSEKKLNTIKKKINKTQSDMEKIASEKGITDNAVIALSRVIDIFHNDYNQIAKGIKLNQQKEHVRIQPTGIAFAVILINSVETEIGEYKTLEEAKQIAFTIAKSYQRSVYY